MMKTDSQYYPLRYYDHASQFTEFNMQKPTFDANFDYMRIGYWFPMSDIQSRLNILNNCIKQTSNEQENIEKETTL
jgi:hypothetical protein